MVGLGLEGVTLAVIIGTLGAIVYCMRVLVMLERRIARMDESLLRIVTQVEREEKTIEGMLRKKK